MLKSAKIRRTCLRSHRQIRVYPRSISNLSKARKLNWNLLRNRVSPKKIGFFARHIITQKKWKEKRFFVYMGMKNW